MSGTEDRDAFTARMEEQYGRKRRPETAEAFTHRMERSYHRLSAGTVERHARQLGAGIAEFAAPFQKYPGVLMDVMGAPEWVKDVPMLPPGPIALTQGLLKQAGAPEWTQTPISPPTPTVRSMQAAGEASSAAAEQIAPPEIMAGSWTEKAVRAGPSVPKYLAASAFGGPVGVGALGAIENAVSSYERALDLTGDPKKAKAAFAIGHFIGALEAIGGVGGKEVTGNILKRIIFGGKDELLQEALSAGLNAKSIELVSDMDLDVAKEMWDDGTIGFLFGGVTHGLTGSRYDEGVEPKKDYGKHPPQLEGVGRKPGGEPGVREEEEAPTGERPATEAERNWAMRFLEKTTGRRHGTPLGEEEGGEKKTERDEMLEALGATEEAEASMGKEIAPPTTEKRLSWPKDGPKTLKGVDPNLTERPSGVRRTSGTGDTYRYIGGDELRKRLADIGAENKIPSREVEDALDTINQLTEDLMNGDAGMEETYAEQIKVFNGRLKKWISEGRIPAPVVEEIEIEPTPIQQTEEVRTGPVIGKLWPQGTKGSLIQTDPDLNELPDGVDIFDPKDFYTGSDALAERLGEIGRDHGVPPSQIKEAQEQLGRIKRAVKRPTGKLTDTTLTAGEALKESRDAYNGTIRRWIEQGFLPRPVPLRGKIKRPSRQHYRDALDTVGKSVGASDEDIQAAQEALNAAPDEIGIDDEYVRIANILRERATGQAPIGAPFPPRRMGKEEPEPPDTTTKGSYVAPDLTLRGKQAIGRRKFGQAPSEPPTGKTTGPRPAVYTPRRRELDLRPEDVAAEEQLKGQAEVAGEAILQKHKAETEPKTGLLNEAGFKRNLREIAEKAKRLKQRMVVIYVDLRDLTGLNYLFGHQTADEIIGHDFGPDDRKGFVGRWADVARQADARGARTGLGDEFESAGVVSSKGDPMVIVERLEALADAELEEQGLGGTIAGRKFGADAGWAEVDLSNPDLDAAIAEARARADQMSKKRKQKANPKKKKLSAEQFAKLAPKAQKERARRLAARKAQGGAQEPTAQMAQPGGPGTTGMASTKPAASSADPEPLFGGIPWSTSGLMQSAKQSKKAIRDWMQKQLLSRGFTPEEARRITEEAEGEIAAMDRYIRITRRALEKARKKSKVSLEELREALENPAKLAALPEPVRAAAAKARADIDRLSRIFVSKGLVRGKLAEAFKKGEGQYLHRTYRAHHDPNWSDTIPQEIKNRLHSLLMSYAQPLSKADRTALTKRARAGDREARWEVSMRRAFKGMSANEITNEINGILKEAREHALNPWVHLTKGKLGRKDLSLFMKRKGLPEEFRDLLGEEKNPLVNYADTMLRLSTYLARSRQFLRMRAAGLRDGWLSEKRTDTNLVQISSDQNKALAPLNGLYTSPEIKAALLEEAPKVGGMVEQTIRGVGGWWKRSKTIENIPLGPLKQIAQNFELFISVGHPVHYPKALYYAWKATTGSLDPKVQRYIELNLIQTGVLQSELDELWRNFKRQRGPRATLKEFERHLGEAFGIGDNAARIAFFEHKKKILEKAGYAEDEAERIAADQALDAVPTPMRLPRLAKTIRPYSGLISYAVERVRTIANLIQISVAEMRSDNPVLQKNGAITLARMAAVGYGFRALRQWINALNGIDDDEEADMDRLSPYWARGKTPIRLGDSKSGRFFDLSQFDHLAWVSEPTAALLAGDPKRALKALSDELIDPFITIPFFETVMGKTAVQFVGELAGEKPRREKGTAQERFMKEVVPGTPGLGWVFPMKDFIKRIHEIPSDIFPALIGARSYKYDPMGALVTNARYAQGQLVGVSEKTDEKLADTSRETLEGAMQYADKNRAGIFEELHLDVEAAIRLGFTKKEIFESLLAGGISEENALAIMAGVVPSSRKLVGDKALEKRREEALAR